MLLILVSIVSVRVASSTDFYLVIAPVARAVSARQSGMAPFGGNGNGPEDPPHVHSGDGRTDSSRGGPTQVSRFVISDLLPAVLDLSTRLHTRCAVLNYNVLYWNVYSTLHKSHSSCYGRTGVCRLLPVGSSERSSIQRRGDRRVTIACEQRVEWVRLEGAKHNWEQSRTQTGTSTLGIRL